MPPAIKLGEPFNSPFVGNPAVMAMEEAGIQSPQVEAAMKAASTVIGEMANTSSMGGDPVVSETDKIVCATARSAMNHPQDLGPARLIRLGLFLDDYRQFRKALYLKAILDQLVAQKSIEFGVRAQEWAREVHSTVQAADARRAEPGVPWRKLLIFTGIGAFVLAVFRAIFASNREVSREVMVFDPNRVIRPIERVPERLTQATSAPPAHAQEDYSDNEEDEQAQGNLR